MKCMVSLPLVVMIFVHSSAWLGLERRAFGESSETEFAADVYMAVVQSLVTIRNFDVKMTHRKVALPSDPAHFDVSRPREILVESRFIHDVATKNSFHIEKFHHEEEKHPLAEELKVDYFVLHRFDEGKFTSRKMSATDRAPVDKEKTVGFDYFLRTSLVGSPQLFALKAPMFQRYFSPTDFKSAEFEGRKSRNTLTETLPDGTVRITHKTDEDVIRQTATYSSRDMRVLQRSMVLKKDNKWIPDYTVQFDYKDEKHPQLPTRIDYKTRNPLVDLRASTERKRVDGELEATMELTWLTVDAPGTIAFPDLKKLAYDPVKWQSFLVADENSKALLDTK